MAYVKKTAKGKGGTRVSKRYLVRDPSGMMIEVVRHSKDGKIVRGDPRTVKFGSVKIKVSDPANSHVGGNVKWQSDKFDRAIKGIAKPGVRIEFRNGIPRYKADPSNPKLLLRTLDGKTERGSMRGGKFVAKE